MNHPASASVADSIQAGGTTSLAFADHTVESAPAGSRRSLEQAKKTFGFVPSPMARMASVPAVIHGFEALHALWQRTSLSHIEREALVLTVAVHNRCHYCVAMHSALLARSPAAADVVDRLRRGDLPADQRLAALVRFTTSALERAGQVEDGVARDFLRAGFSSEQALEVVLGIATFTLSTFANRLTAAPLDAAFAAFEWHRS